MAKTYKEWEQEAKDSGLYDTFTDVDLGHIQKDVDFGDFMLGQKRAYNAAETDEQRKQIAEDTNFERQKKGYKNTVSGDGKGGYTTTSAPTMLSILKAYDDSLTKDKSSKYLTSIDNILMQIAGDKFSYNPKNDTRYKLAEEYAKNAMQNQMAESAFLTGGYGNSYAALAGQQVYTDYMDKAVNDMEDRAYAKWAAERDNKLSLLGIARDMEAQQYERDLYEEEKKAAEEAAAAKATEEENAAMQKSAENSVIKYIEAYGTLDGLPEELIAASGLDPFYLYSLASIAQRKLASAAAEETRKAETHEADIANIISTIENRGKDDENAYDTSSMFDDLRAAGKFDLQSATNAIMLVRKVDEDLAEDLALQYLNQNKSEVYELAIVHKSNPDKMAEVLKASVDVVGKATVEDVIAELVGNKIITDEKTLKDKVFG